jgi:hypothetical protein
LRDLLKQHDGHLGFAEAFSLLRISQAFPSLTLAQFVLALRYDKSLVAELREPGSSEVKLKAATTWEVTDPGFQRRSKAKPVSVPRLATPALPAPPAPLFSTGARLAAD